jgi:RNA polymerase sigma factor (sigma-70 family)
MHSVVVNQFDFIYFVEISSLKNKMNQAEFKAFYNECWRYCKPRLRNLTTNQADIEDIFAEAIARFWVNIQNNKVAHADNHNALVYVMAKNLFLGNYRKNKGHFNVSIDAQNDEEKELQLTDNEQDFTENNIKLAWEKLDEKCRNLLNATLIYKERQEELIEKMNFKNTDTVKATKYRCLQYLKKYYYEVAA